MEVARRTRERGWERGEGEARGGSESEGFGRGAGG